MRLTQGFKPQRCIKKLMILLKHKYAIWVNASKQIDRGASSNQRVMLKGNIQGAFAVQQTTAVNMYLTKSEEEKSSKQL